MSQQFTEASEPYPSRKMGEIVAYSSHIQEAMRYNKLSSSDYRLAMTIMHAVSRGLTEEKWKEEQHKTVTSLISQSPDENMPHVDAENRYEQTVSCFKDLVLWPW